MRGERAWGDGSASGVHGEGPTQGWGGQGRRGAHPEHLAHVRDLGRVPIAERLVERPRALPRRKAGMRCEKRYRPGRREGVGWRRRNQHARGGPDSRLGPRARAERTENM